MNFKTANQVIVKKVSRVTIAYKDQRHLDKIMIEQKVHPTTMKEENLCTWVTGRLAQESEGNLRLMLQIETRDQRRESLEVNI